MSQSTSDSAELEALEPLYARTAYLLRESRKEILRRYAAENEAALLNKIRQGLVAEHPGYEHYLSALILEQMRVQVQAEMIALETGNLGVLPAISQHVILKEKLELHYAERMTEAPRLAQDALILAFDTGMLMELRYYSGDEYSVNWNWGERELRLDTAPVRVDQANFPRHVHDADGRLRADTVTRAGADCWGNFSRLLAILLKDPLLEGEESVPRMEASK